MSEGVAGVAGKVAYGKVTSLRTMATISAVCRCGAHFFATGETAEAQFKEWKAHECDVPRWTETS